MIGMSARSRVVLLSLILPVSVHVFACALALAWSPRLPDPIATQWDSMGVTNSNSLWLYYLVFAAFVFLPILVALLAIHAKDTLTRRLCTGITLCSSIFMSFACMST